MYAEISRNKRDTFLLFIVFFFLLMALGAAFGFVIGGFSSLGIGGAVIGLVLASLLAIVLTVVQYYNGDKLILAVSKAKPVEHNQYPFLDNTVEGLAIAAGVPKPKLYVMEENSPNAFATGRDPQHASICVTTGLLKSMNRLELESVIGHEMSHIKNFDIRYMMIISVLVGVVILLADWMWRFAFVSSHNNNDNKGGGAIIVIAIVLAILAPIFAQIIRMAVSRRREYLADADGALLTRYPEGLASALEKIHKDPDPLVDSANKATAHLFIANPMRNVSGTVSHWFSTHPPVEERIARLRGMPGMQKPVEKK